MEAQISLVGLLDGQEALSGETSAVVGIDEVEMVIAFCGDAQTQTARAEACDDGNDIEGDGCDSNCTVSACGNGIFAPGEICFTPAGTSAVGLSPNSVTAGDFNGDGLLDLTVANGNSDTVSYLVNLGQAEFLPQLSFDVFKPAKITAADFDLDGFLDLVTANPQINRITILQNTGEVDLDNEALRFITLSSLVTGQLPVDVAVGDLDLDGFLEVITSSLSGDVFLRENQSSLGAITFETHLLSFLNGPNIFDLGTPNGVVIGNFNVDQDGLPDIAITIDFPTPQLAVVLAEQGSPFEPRLSPILLSDLSFKPQAAGLEVADLDGDGRDDLVVIYEDQPQLGALLGQGDGTFADELRLDLTASATEVAVEDLNGDGIPDLALVDRTEVSIFTGEGDGTFAAGVTFSAGTNPDGLTIADLSGDGLPDLVVANQGSNDVSLFLFNP